MFSRNSTNLASQPEDSTRSQSCCSHHNQLVQIRQSVDETTSFLRSLSNILPLLQRIDSANNSQFQNNLCNVANEIRESNLQIYRTFLTMQSALPPQVERQQPVYFHDACGLQSPFHLEFINSWEAFVAVLSVKFKQRGLFVVEKKQYVLEDANHRRLIDMNRPFEACFFPGQQVNMDACFDENSDTANCCPVCRHAEFGSQDEAIDGYCLESIDEVVLIANDNKAPAVEHITNASKKSCLFRSRAGRQHLALNESCERKAMEMIPMQAKIPRTKFCDTDEFD